MIDKPPPFKGLNIRIPIIILVKGKGFVDPNSEPETLKTLTLETQNPGSGLRGSGLGFRVPSIPVKKTLEEDPRDAPE